MDRSTRERHQVGDLASIQRELENAFVFDHLAYGRAACFNLHGIRLHFHLFRNLTYFEYKIDHRAAVHLQHDAGLDVGAKSGKSRLQAIWARRNVRQDKRPGFITHGGSHDSRIGLRRRDLDAGQYRPALITNRAADLGSGLRPQAHACESEHEQ